MSAAVMERPDVRTDDGPEDGHTLTTEQMLEALHRHVALVTLTVAWPKLNRKIAGANVVIQIGEDEEEVAEGNRSDPSWKLLPKNWRTRLHRIESQARKIMHDAGIGFTLRGCVMMPQEAVPRVFEAFEALNEQFRAEAAELRNAYDEVVIARLKQDLGEKQFELVAPSLPRAEEIESKIQMRWMVIPLDRGEGVEEHLATIRAAAADAPPHVASRLKAAADSIEKARESRVEKAAAPYLKAARTQFERQLRETMRTMAEEPQQRLLLAVDKFREQLQGTDGKGRITKASIDGVRKAFQHLSEFRFLADGKVLDRMREVERLLEGATPKELNAGQVSEALTKALDDLAERARAEVPAEEAERRFRRIRYTGET